MAKPWMDKDQYPVVHDDHHHDLETRAAVHEFKGGLSREEAEGKAYKEYLHNTAKEAAAHHLVGMKTAQAAGDQGAAEKHGMAYASAVKAMGHEPVGPVPESVLEHVKKYRPSTYSFKAHKHDEIIPQGKLDDGLDEKLQGHLDKIQELRGQLK